MKQPELYRTPRKPGYLGGYNWRATALGLLLLVVVNFGATQYIAAQFQYQPALGRPLLQTRTGGVYEPSAPVVCGSYNPTSRGPRIPNTLYLRETVCFAGWF